MVSIKLKNHSQANQPLVAVQITIFDVTAVEYLSCPLSETKILAHKKRLHTLQPFD